VSTHSERARNNDAIPSWGIVTRKGKKEDTRKRTIQKISKSNAERNRKTQKERLYQERVWGKEEPRGYRGSQRKEDILRERLVTGGGEKRDQAVGSKNEWTAIRRDGTERKPKDRVP